MAATIGARLFSSVKHARKFQSRLTDSSTVLTWIIRRGQWSVFVANRIIIKREDKINEGDIVLIGTDDKKRLHWLLGRVLELFPGKDGIIRLLNCELKGRHVKTNPTTVPFGRNIKPVRTFFYVLEL
ncbi:hypothetical protein TNCV_3209231 [Trichonephila clavipes]|nr:hypothetical protein TNCV_3209231 [Trichonephila clavipes]